MRCKGKIFIIVEEALLCYSYLVISQDPILFFLFFFFWGERLRHLECGKDGSKFSDKMETIEHDVSKFHGIYQNVKDLNESGHNEEDIIHESLVMYQLKHPKAVDFVFFSIDG